jgi:hypothetical protein
VPYYLYELGGQISMTFATSIDYRNNYIYISTDGPVNEENIVALGKLIHTTCSKKELFGAVVDCSKMQGALNSGELYFATSKFIAEVGNNINVAYINPPADWIPSEDYFSRFIARSKGGSLELFRTEEDAAEWLKSCLEERLRLK